MAYDEGLAEEVRARLHDIAGLSERRMFGGLCFMDRGNMICGIAGDGLMMRVGKDGMEEALTLPDVEPMEMGGRVMGGFVTIHGEGDGDAIARLFEMSRRLAAALPPK